ncbi:MAG: hypothetical protein WBZ29_12300 [Methanocella sp.]
MPANYRRLPPTPALCLTPPWNPPMLPVMPLPRLRLWAKSPRCWAVCSVFCDGSMMPGSGVSSEYMTDSHVFGIETAIPITWKVRWLTCCDRGMTARLNWL